MIRKIILRALASGFITATIFIIIVIIKNNDLGAKLLCQAAGYIGFFIFCSINFIIKSLKD